MSEDAVRRGTVEAMEHLFGSYSGHIGEAVSNIYFWSCMICSPSVLFRPTLSIDGDQWCALYGSNLQEGVAGFGDSPEEAMADFDKSWRAKLLRQED